MANNLDAQDGAAMLKTKSNPKLVNIAMIGAVAVPVPLPPDPDQAVLIKTSNFDHALDVLKVDIPIDTISIDGTLGEMRYRIRKTADLQTAGMINQIPVLREISQKMVALHKLHDQLDSSYRSQRAIEQLLSSVDQLNQFTQMLEIAADYYDQES